MTAQSLPLLLGPKATKTTVESADEGSAVAGDGLVLAMLRSFGFEDRTHASISPLQSGPNNQGSQQRSGLGENPTTPNLPTKIIPTKIA